MADDILKPLEAEDTEEKVVELAKRILKVYGEVKSPVLDKEIERMANLLDIPLEEVLPYG